MINDFKYNYVVDTCVDYQQIQKCSTLRFSKGGFKDNQPWKGVDLHFRCLYKVLNAILFLQKYVIVLIALTFENLNPSVVKTAPSFGVVLISSGFLKNSYKDTIIMNLITKLNLQIWNSKIVQPFLQFKMPSLQVLKFYDIAHIWKEKKVKFKSIQ